MMKTEPRTSKSPTSPDLAEAMAERDFRSGYMGHQLRAFLADQIHALRGTMSQKAFGAAIGKPQSVVSRLESEDYGKVSLQTLIDIAEKLDIALLVRFVDHPTFLVATRDFSRSALAPARYDQGTTSRHAASATREPDPLPASLVPPAGAERGTARGAGPKRPRHRGPAKGRHAARG